MAFSPHIPAQGDNPYGPLSAPLDLEGGRSLPLFGGILKWVSAFVLFLIVLAAFAPVHEVAIAQGEIIPEGQVQQVQHLEGGIVAAVLVKAGDPVAEGQPLIRLAPVQASSERDQLQSRQADLKQQVVRLAALLSDGEPQFDLAATSSHGREQAAFYESEKALVERERSTLRSRIAQRESELAALTTEKANLGEQLAIEEEQFRLRDELYKQGYSSKVAYLTAKAKVVETRSKLSQATDQAEAAQNALAEAKDLLAEYGAKKTREWSELMAKARADLAETDAALKRLDDRVDRLYIRAPVKGFVQEIMPNAPGEVIRAGDLVAKIVPSDEHMVAEVKLTPNHIGHVKVGHPVEIKVTAFDAELYGAVKGEVKSISPTTFQTQEGDVYYKAIIALDREAVGRGGKTYPLLPGMMVQADIITGSKSVMQYLLKPIYRSLDVAFSER